MQQPRRIKSPRVAMHYRLGRERCARGGEDDDELCLVESSCIGSTIENDAITIIIIATGSSASRRRCLLPCPLQPCRCRRTPRLRRRAREGDTLLPGAEVRPAAAGPGRHVAVQLRPLRRLGRKRTWACTLIQCSTSCVVEDVFV